MPRSQPLAPFVAALFRSASPFARHAGPGQRVLAKGDPTAALSPGLNFARQDYLALSRHPLALEAPACSAQTADLLADRIARFVQLQHATVHPSGTDAIHATFLRLLAPGDDIIIDAAAPLAMAAAVRAAGAQVHRCPPGSLDGVERRLLRLSRQARRGRLFVAVPTVAAMTSVAADLAELAALCAMHGARLIADVSHDLGANAPGGRGLMELQACLGQIDVVLGSFSKCFGAPGGFAAFRDPDLAQDELPSSTLSATHATAILAALDLIDSAEGRRRRRRLHGNALRLRNHLMADGLRVLGHPSPLVPVPLPAAEAPLLATLLASAGPMVPLLQAPLVSRHAPRWRVIMSSDHGPADIDDLADLICDVIRSAQRRQRSAPLRLATP